MQNRKRRLLLSMIMTMFLSVFFVAIFFAANIYENDEFLPEFLQAIAAWDRLDLLGLAHNDAVQTNSGNVTENGTATMRHFENGETIATAMLHYITWPFVAYAEACFTAVALGSFEPQEITTYYERDGWAQIVTASGNGWVYVSADKIYTQQTTRLFSGTGADYFDGWMPPQVVRVIERQGDWLQINNGERYAWINFSFVPPIHVLEDFMRPFGNTLSVFYENLATGFTFAHNANRVYFGASATKAPFALYIFHKLERGETSMNDIFTYTGGDFWGGSGVIQHSYGVGTNFTQRRLLYLMISPSDNIATRILRRVHTYQSYTSWVESIGGNPGFVQNITYSYLSANEAGFFLRKFYDYINSGGQYSHEFRDMLLANRYQFLTSDYPIASKSGWARNFGQAWHDMGIVFAPSPYSLALLSSLSGNASDRRDYNAISMFIQEFNSRWFYPLG